MHSYTSLNNLTVNPQTTLWNLSESLQEDSTEEKLTISAFLTCSQNLRTKKLQDGGESINLTWISDGAHKSNSAMWAVTA